MATAIATAAMQVVSQAWARGLRPPPPLSISAWAAANRVVAPPSPDPGRWRNERTPYLVGIMDCASPSHPAREIDFMKGTQIGGTAAMENAIGFYSDQAPTSGLIVLPSKDVAREWSVIRMQALFENTPVLRRLIEDDKNKRRAKANTTYSKRLGNGATWKLAWSSSGKVLRSTPAAFILADEVDGFVKQVGGECEPIDLLSKRFANFIRGKFFRVSSPTDRTSSRIERGFKDGDQRYYFLPCPQCGHYQRLIFQQLNWEQGGADNRAERASKVSYECVACKGRIGEHHKTEMLRRGLWVATRARPQLVQEGFATVGPEIREVLGWMEEETHPSFHLSALYSPVGWYSWAQCAIDWERAKDDPERLKVFVMTTLGETWIDRGEAPDWEKVYNRREDYEEGVVPRGGLFLTCGVDVQEDRLEGEIVAWGRGKESWSITYFQLRGDTSTQEPWRLLENVLAQDWPTWDGKAMPIMVMAIDSGYRPQMVYEFARRHSQASHGPTGSRITAPRTVVPTKGGSDPYRINAGVSSSDAARKRFGIKIVKIGTPAVKQEIYDCLRLPAPTNAGESYPPGYPHYPSSYDTDYYQGLCSEMRITRVSGKVEWIKVHPGARNEPLDIRGCARLAANLYGIDRFTDRQWLQMGWNQDLQRVVAAQPKTLPSPRAPAAVIPTPPSMERKAKPPRPRIIPSPYI